MTEPFEIRQAHVDDADAIADLHIESWPDVYGSILPKSYLEQEIRDDRRRFWNQALSNPVAGNFVLVVARDGELLGFVSIIRRVDSSIYAKIESIHIRPGQRSCGIGRHLLKAAVQRLRDEGMSSLCLWVFDQNVRAIKFYEDLGGSADKTEFDDFAGGHMPHTWFVWHDLSGLSDACAC